MILFYAASAAALPTFQDSRWTVLEENPITVACGIDMEEPWCRARHVFPCSTEFLEKLFLDAAGYSLIFERVEESVWLEPDVAYIRMDMPFVFSHRDYVVQFSREKRGDLLFLNFNSVLHPEKPPVSGVHRLKDYAGSWTLKSVSPNKTIVGFYWNSDYELPVLDSQIPRVRLNQGKSIMQQMLNACEKK